MGCARPRPFAASPAHFHFIPMRPCRQSGAACGQAQRDRYDPRYHGTAGDHHVMRPVDGRQLGMGRVGGFDLGL